MTCTRCENTGFLNLHQVDKETLKAFDESGRHEVILNWMATHKDSDVQICDCCGNGENWYGTPGEHYNSFDPRGKFGPYTYNGGLAECN